MRITIRASKTRALKSKRRKQTGTRLKIDLEPVRRDVEKIEKDAYVSPELRGQPITI